MLGHLTILSGIVTALALIILGRSITKDSLLETTKYFIIGFLAAFIDFIIEYAGTHFGQWHYLTSIYMIKGLVPIELIFIFFSCGILLRFIFTNMPKIKAPIKLNTLLYITIIFALAIYARELYLGLDTYAIVFAIPIGMWGIINIPDKNRESAFAIALFVGFIDLILELIIIDAGGYHYTGNFTLLIPMTYILLTLGMLGLIEQFCKLDAFLNKPLVRKILHNFFGIKRHKNTKFSKKCKK
jgi:hypothetical protein